MLKLVSVFIRLHMVYGQNKLKLKPKELKNFLKFYDQGDSGVYDESGFVIEALVKKFGKNKLLELIKSLRTVSSESQFYKVFKKKYGFRINYKTINKFYTNIKRKS